MAVLSINDGLYLGADGCRGGWIACILDHGELRLERCDSVKHNHSGFYRYATASG